jgi:hypothetical protein
MACSDAGFEDSLDVPPEVPALGTHQSALRFSFLDRCDGAEKDAIRGAEQIADYITHPNVVAWITERRPLNKPHWIVDKFFDTDGVYDDATAQYVRDQIGKIHREIHGADVIARCRNIFPCSDSSRGAYVWPRAREKITFCPSYFDMDRAVQPAIWAHELSHEMLGTLDDVATEYADDVHDLRARKASYGATERFVNEGRGSTATQYDGFVHTLLGEYFDGWYQTIQGRPITAREFNQALIDVQHGFNPIDRIWNPNVRCWEGTVRSNACHIGYDGRDVTRCVDGEWHRERSCFLTPPGFRYPL